MKDLFSIYWKRKITHLNMTLDHFPKFSTLTRFRINTCRRVALGFVLSDTSIDTALVGTSSPAHLLECMNTYKERPNDPNLYERLRRWYQ